MKRTHPLYRWFAHSHPPGHVREHGWHDSHGALEVTLADLQNDERAVVVRLGGGRSVVQRLAALGFTPGADVQVAQNYGWGPLIVSTRGARVALGRGEARRLIVERKPS